jgi:hypothetical protein
LTGTAVCDFQLTVRGRHVDVTYPSNTGTYSSFYSDDYLGVMGSDYTAFRVTAADVGRPVRLRLHLSYVVPGGGYRLGGDCTGRPVTRTLVVPLGVLRRP